MSRLVGPGRWTFAVALVAVLIVFALIGMALVVVALGQLPAD
jgi:hypothetical protein